MDKRVDEYLIDGCGRCDYYATPQCKVNFWRDELKLLRNIVNNSGLEEEIKWSMPCYTYKGANVAMIAAFKDYCSLSFFKGVLIKDTAKLLHKQGESSQSARLFKFTNRAQIESLEPMIMAYLHEAIDIEIKGLKVEFAKQPEPIPTELEDMFVKMPELKSAFFALTPGKQRGYLIHFNQPKQSATRLSRIEKNIQKILNGEAFY
jgi:uncharacterized protein YdeI (YjbR/CyaY-like superfamily)